MNEITLEWHTYRLLPYERRLGLREVRVLVGGKAYAHNGSLVLRGGSSRSPGFQRLTYFRRVSVNGSDVVVPVQAKLEATASGAKHGPALRQSTRYSAHGLHEYRGKFNPQIVRATANLLGLGTRRPARLLDPFCGSGTCLLEAAHMGWDALGLDLNPLAVLISNAKIQALRLPLESLERCQIELSRSLTKHREDLDFEKEFTETTLSRLNRLARTDLPNEDYLRGWFPPSVLVQLRLIRSEITHSCDKRLRSIANIILSDILRSVSLQDPADLRIRRRADARQNYPVVPLFLASLEQRLSAIVEARKVIGAVRGTQQACLADSRNALPSFGAGEPDLFDGVITSPPYATALPYIDTQRLSLAILGLATAPQLRLLEKRLIGSREISGAEREREERSIDSFAGGWPDSVLQVCRRIQHLAAQEGNGFRRRNMPALLLRYFQGMRCAFQAAISRVRVGGRFAMVVGTNTTTLSGQRIVINTPRLLSKTAETVGWATEEIMPLDTYPRFDIHRSNSIMSEKLVVLRRPR